MCTDAVLEYLRPLRLRVVTVLLLDETDEVVEEEEVVLEAEEWALAHRDIAVSTTDANAPRRRPTFKDESEELEELEEPEDECATERSSRSTSLGSNGGSPR